MGIGLSIGLLVGGIAVLILILVATRRKMPAGTAAQTSRRMSLTSPLAPAAVIKKLQAARWRRIKVHDTDAARGVVVLATGVTGFSWGFFYPVFVTPSGSGSTLEIGIKSRIFQAGPVVTNNHKAAVAEIEQVLKDLSAPA
jgi:hypothetical protein